jgi:hypothetical protein
MANPTIIIAITKFCVVAPITNNGIKKRGLQMDKKVENFDRESGLMGNLKCETKVHGLMSRL